MGSLREFRALTDAESFFEFFGLEFEPRVLEKSRVPILRRFALELDALDRDAPELSEPERLRRYAEGLRRAYEGCASEAPRAAPGRDRLVTLGSGSSCGGCGGGC